ncbi:hypothetical protein SLOPH_2222 [Spraguea lophii 42_110]|uniref:Uncharacterized protein n=1 Tax=Spraguea lophii (strain 42_110) TaxID=1358809 RepID=S7XJX6_SPRLO|nr:hypothetical protein SLOPH_2222 [Spraguea lophii 42_110]
MNDYPHKLRLELLKYTIPFFIIILPLFKKDISPINFCYSFISIFTIFFSVKTNFIIANILFFSSIILNSNELYFIAFGVSLSAGYNGFLFVSQIYKEYNFQLWLKIECIALCASIFLRRYIHYEIILSIISMFIIFRINKLPMETLMHEKSKFLKEVYKRLTNIFGKTNYINISMEYKRLVEIMYNKKKKNFNNALLFVLSPINILLPTVFIVKDNFFRLFILLSVFIPSRKSIISNILFFIFYFYNWNYMVMLIIPFMDFTSTYIPYNKTEAMIAIMIKLSVCLVLIYIGDYLKYVIK